MKLSPEDKKLLLSVARETLETHCRGGGVLSLEGRDFPPALEEKRGAFVTLRTGGSLRGCIGYPRPVGSLVSAVRDNAVSASSSDPRFAPVSVSELDRISVEISALCAAEPGGSPFVPVNSPEEIVIGRDGLYVEYRGRGGGLLLPQVPVEQGWNLSQYLEGLCRKAGMTKELFSGGDARLFRFEAEVFGGDGDS